MSEKSYTIQLQRYVARYRDSLGVAFVTLIVMSLLFVLSLSVTPDCAFGAPQAKSSANEHIESFMTGKAKSAQFASPQGCTCHAELEGQWNSSMHAKSLTDPFYLAQTKQVEHDAGKDVVKFCDTCHAPAAVMAGGVHTAQTNDALNGITCTVCHQVTAHAGKKVGNASLAYPKGGPDGVLHAQLMDPQAAHQASGVQLYNSSEYCGACHNVMHPANGLKLETTYDEWKKSTFAVEGVTCQNCHMVSDASLKAPVEGQAAMGAPTRKDIFAMTFVGANVSQGNPELSKAMLQKAATVEIDAPSDIVPAGKQEKVQVRIKNTGAGHSIPTGLTEVRNMWLTVYAVGADGAKTELGRTEFGTKLADENGKDVGAKFWLGAKKKSELRIKAGETYTKDIEVTMPSDTEAQTVVAELNYQSARDADIASSKVENPTTVMAQASYDMYSSEDAKKSGAAIENAPSEDTSNQDILPAMAVSAIILVTVIAVLVIIRKRQEKKR